MFSFEELQNIKLLKPDYLHFLHVEKKCILLVFLQWITISGAGQYEFALFTSALGDSYHTWTLNSFEPVMTYTLIFKEFQSTKFLQNKEYCLLPLEEERKVIFKKQVFI